ncbi:MAG: DUF1993 domain-containing protein [Hyphomicrobium sp.]
MNVSMYKASVASFSKHLHALDGLLDKAAAYAEAKKIDPSVLLSARLYPDMFSMKKQVQEACMFATSAPARLTGSPVPPSEGDDATIADLKTRIARTQAFLATITPEQFTGAAEKTLTLKVGPNDMTFSGEDYLLHFALPNFYFHCSTAYGILRHNGLVIGKRDFMRRT